MSVFILGLGAQKSGTTWLFRYLSSDPEFSPGFSAEYHIWDELDIPEQRNWGVRKKSDWRSWIGWHAAKRRERMKRDPNYYFDYFAGLLKKGARISGDITPAYSGLRADRLQYIKDQFKIRGVEVKVVFLMRDPVDRVISAARSNLDKGNFFEGVPSGATFFEALKTYYPSEHCEFRTRYEKTISEVNMVFNRTDVHFDFYEKIFKAGEIDELSKFVGYAPNKSFLEKKFNVTKSKAARSGLEEEIMRYYDSTYSHVYAEWPEIKKYWRRN